MPVADNISVEVAFRSKATAPFPMYQDITDYVSSLSMERGRSYEFDEMEAGTLNLSLDNADGRFTPARVASPYFPNVKPRRPVRVVRKEPRNLFGPDMVDIEKYGESRSLLGERAFFDWTATAPAALVGEKIRMSDMLYSAGDAYVLETKTAGFPPSAGFPVEAAWEFSTPYVPVKTGSPLAFRFTVRRLATAAPLRSETALAVGIMGVQPDGGQFPIVEPTNYALPANTGGQVEIKIESANPSPGGRFSHAYLFVANATGAYCSLTFRGFVAAHTSANLLPVHDKNISTKPMWTGFIEKWPLQISGTLSTMNVTATDAMASVTNSLKSPYAEWISANDPVLYFPLTDGTDAANPVDPLHGYKGEYRYSNVGGDGAPGAESFLEVGVGSSDTCYEVTAGDGTTGRVVLVKPPQEANYRFQGGEANQIRLFAQRPAGQAVVLYDEVLDSGRQGRRVVLNAEGKITASFGVMGDPVWRNMGSATATPADTPLYVTVDHYADGYALATVSYNDPKRGWVSDYAWTSDNFPTNFGNRIREFAIGGTVKGGAYPVKVSHFAAFSGKIPGLGVPVVRTPVNLPGPDGLAFSEAGNATRLDRFRTGGRGPLTEVDVLEFALRRAGVPPHLFAFDPGVNSVGAFDWDDEESSLGEAVRQATGAGGVLFVDATGRWRYQARYRRFNAPLVATLGDSVNIAPESDYLFESDAARLANDVTVTGPSDTEYRSVNAPSVDEYGRATREIVTTTNEPAAGQGMAEWITYRWAEPMIRCDQLTINVTAQPGALEVVAGLDIGDRIALTGLPDAAPYAPGAVVPFFVEGINHDVQVEGENPEWTTTLQLSPGDKSSVITLNDPVYGNLGDHVLAY